LEKIVSKTNETLNPDRHALADGELDAVTGGTVGEFIDGIATGILGPSLADKVAIAAMNALGRILGGGW
jgi:hypothetical protein